MGEEETGEGIIEDEVKGKVKVKVKECRGGQNIAPYQTPKQTKCVTAITDTETRLGTVLHHPPVRGPAE